MIDEEVLGGLKSALERGESLKKAMTAMYNAGYKKEEIEECARRLVEFSKGSPVQPTSSSSPVRFIREEAPKPQAKQAPVPLAKQVQKPEAPIKELIRIKEPVIFKKSVIQPEIQEEKKAKPVQPAKSKSAYLVVLKVSDYGIQVTSREKTVIIVLVFLLIFLLAGLGLIFLFKDQIINFFSSLFG